MKLHIDDDAFAGQRFDDLIQELGFTKIQAAGLLALFWKESQSRGLIEATAEEIKSCMAVPRADRERVFAALLACTYLSPVDDTTDYEIRGNKKHVEALQRYKEMGSRGGRNAHKKKAENEKLGQAQAANKPSVGSSVRSSVSSEKTDRTLVQNQPSSDQISSDPIRSVQIRSDLQNKKGDDPKKTATQLALVPTRTVKPTAPEGTHRVIARYCEVWKTRYHDAKIHLGGKAAGQLKTLTKDHGEASAIKLVEAYLQMPDSWFVTKRHDVGTLMENLNAVSHFLSTGRHVTKKEIKHLDDAMHTQNLLDAIDRGDI